MGHLLAHDGARPLLVAAVLLPLAPRVGGRLRPRHRWLLIVLAGLALAWTLFGARHEPRVAAGLLPRHEPMRVFMALVAPLGDLDGDHASLLFGGRDCAALDPFVGPHAAEIAGNGVDDNCLLGDLADDSLPALPAFGPAWLAGADILILSVDALRPDRMSMFGYPRRTTPEIDRHFADAYRFHDAYAEAASTRDTLPSLLSGRRLLDLRWHVDDTVVLGPDNRFLGDHLPAYHPVGVLPFTAVNMLGSARLGLGPLTIYDDHDGRGSTATRVTDTLLAAHRRLPAPRLLFAHYYEPHEPHVAHASFSAVSPDLYDQEIARVDRSIGRLLDGLAERGELERTIVVLTADHGEAFDEHGHSFHNVHVFEEDVRVPLLIRVPGRPGGDIRGPVSNTQVVATLLELVGAPTEAWRPLRRAVQLCWQDPLSALNPYLSVAELIDEPRVIHGLPRWRVGSPELHASLARVALEPSIERRRPGTLSGGQRQRVALARALAAEPSLLLADEVTSALDRPVAWALIDLLRGLRGDGLGLLLVTHDLSLLPGTIDQVVVLGGGEVVERGPARELLAAPQHPVSRALRAAVPRLPYS